MDTTSVRQVIFFRFMGAPWSWDSPADPARKGKSNIRVRGDLELESGRSGVEARFADGTALSSDVLIGCDGLRSTVPWWSRGWRGDAACRQ